MKRLLALLSPGGWFAVVAGVGLVILLAWWLMTEPGRKAERDAHDRAGAAVAAAGGRASDKAAEAVSDLAERQADRETLNRENRDAILQTPGASDALPPAVSDAGVRALCLRDSIQRDPRYARLCRESAAVPR